MQKPSCICVHPDGRECLARRLGVSTISLGRFEQEEPTLDPDDRCDCCCHSGDMDGMTAWDDANSLEAEHE